MVKPLGLLEFLRVSCQLSVRRSGRHNNPAILDVGGLLRLHYFLGSVVSDQLTIDGIGELGLNFGLQHSNLEKQS